MLIAFAPINIVNWSNIMKQKNLSLLQFQKKFGTEKACQKQLFRLRWSEGFKCPRCGHAEAYFHRTRIISGQILWLPSFVDRRHGVSQDQNPLNQMVLADLSDGTPEKRHLHAVAATDVGD
jgi:hypothetical protein